MSRRMLGSCLLVWSFIAFAAADDSPDELGLAATCLERGDESAAVSHLARHLKAHPDRPLVRFSLAELLFRRGQMFEAQGHYERFLLDAPASIEIHRRIHIHSQLVEISRQSNDPYIEHLHRGIGFFLLASDPVRESERQEWLCKAAGELNLATIARPQEAQPHWYLHLVWSRLAQSQPADRHLRRAEALAANSVLSQSERRDIAAAARGLDDFR